MTTRAFAVAAAAALAVAAAGCGFLRSAEISSMTPGGNIMTGNLECWLELTFSGEPPGDPTDVEVVFSSVAMPMPQSFDWAFIAQHDQVQKGEFQGYKFNEATQGDAPPPRDMTIRVKFPLQAHQRFRLEAGDELELQATLYWGGEKQHSVSRGIGHVYHAQGSAL